MIDNLHLSVPALIFTFILVPFLFRLVRRSVRLSENHLMRFIASVIDAVSWHVGRFSYQQVAKRASLRRYSSLHLTNPSLTSLHIPGRAQVRVDLTTMYIPLRFDDGIVPISHAEFKNRLAGGRVQVVGDPGSGKTSLIKRTLYELCTANLTRTGRTCLPVLLELKNLNLSHSPTDSDGLGELLLQQLRQQVERVHTYDPSSLFDSYLHGPGVIALLDGLDEVASDAYPLVAEAIKSLSTIFAINGRHNAILLTMRSQYHALVGDDLAEAFPTVLSIEPFTPAEVHHFLQRFPFRSESESHIARIEANLASHPTLRELCFNPLILSMYVVEDLDDPSAAVPDSRTTFYARVTEELLVARRSRQLNLTQRTALREKREAILGSLAFANVLDLERPSNSISFSAAIREVKWIHKARTDTEAEVLLDELIRDTGIITPERHRESLRFIHLTFCDFLAARYCVEGRNAGWQELLDFITKQSGGKEQDRVRTRLGELVPFSFAHLPLRKRTPALRDVAEVGDLQLVAKCLLETQMYDHVVFAHYANQELEYLRQHDASMWDLEWRDRLHLLLIVLDEARSSGQVKVSLPSTEEIYQAIVSNETDKVYHLFSSYVRQDAASAFRLADSGGVDLSRDAPVIVSANCSNRQFVDIALQRLHGLSEEDRRRWAVLFAVGGLMDPAAAQILMSYNSASALSSLPVPRGKRWGVLGVIWRGTDGSGRAYVARVASALLVQFLGGLVSRESLYTQCLGIAYQCDQDWIARQRFDKEIGSIARSLPLLRSPARFVPAFLPVIAIAALSDMGFRMARDEPFDLIDPTYTVSMPAFLVFVLLFWAMNSYADRRNMTYLRVANLADGGLVIPFVGTRWLLRRVHPIAYQWILRRATGRRRRSRGATTRSSRRR